MTKILLILSAHVKNGVRGRCLHFGLNHLTPATMHGLFPDLVAFRLWRHATKKRGDLRGARDI